MVLKSKKHVFWEALMMTIVVFLGGLFLGMMIESNNSNKVSQLYLESDISLTDASALSSLSSTSEYDCETIKNNNIDFANRVYEEAVILEDYQNAGRLMTETMEILHRKYDLLRTLIWSSNKESLERCSNYNILVYLYEAENEDLQTQAKQNVWSKILYEVKKENKDNVLLIPIAVDQNLTSLDLIVSEYKIDTYPAIIINNNNVLTEIDNAKQIESLLLNN